MDKGKDDIVTSSQVSEKLSQRRRIPKLPLIIIALIIGLGGAYAIVRSLAATPTPTNCFSAPSACGYPDATNTGVPAGTSLTASGSITASTPGQVIDAKDVTGTITIAANNVTIQNTRVTSNTDCGTKSTCGNYEILVNDGVTGAVIKNVELRSTAGDTCEHDIRNLGGTLQVTSTYLHGCDSNLYNVGNTTLTDDYGIAKIAIPSDHVENVYMSDSTLTVNHSTLFNPVEQTAVIFADVNGGSGGSCSNHINVTNSFLVGGGYTLYPCGNGTSAGSSVVSITNNRFARCLTADVEQASGGNHLCQSGPDTHGYFPNGGSYNLASYDFNNTVWTGNIWDDNAQAVCDDGSNGCAGSGTTTAPPADTTAPTVSISAPAANATVSGSSTTVSANASDDVGVAGVQFKLDGTNLGSEDTASPYTTTWNTTSATNGTHKLTAVARDAAGNSTTSTSVTVTVNNTTAGGGSSGATRTSNCFSQPSACGYPDATNTGVPAGTTLATSGSVTASTSGQVINGKDITGELTINAPNVTLENSKVHTSSGGSGTTAIVLNQNATNFTIENSEIYGNGSTTNAPESGIWNHYGNAGFKIVNSYVHGSPDNVEGPVDVENSYMIVDAEYSGAHSENIYLCGTPATVNHSTLYNKSDETSLIFGDGICGSGNQVSVTGSLLAGGGWMLQPDSKGVSAPVTITNNRVGRCLGAVSQDSGGGYVCKSGADTNGYWPYGGHYGLATDLGNLTWSGNVWDDNSQAICPTQDGTGSGCSSTSGGGSGGGSGSSDTTKPTVSVTTPTNGSTVSGIVTSAATASDNVGVTKVEFYVDSATTPIMTDTASPYNYSFDSKTLSNGSHSLTAKAYDAAGNTSTAKSTFTVNNADTTPPTTPTNVKATANNATTVNLTWTASTDASGVATYNVLRNGVVIASPTTASYTDTSAVANTSYSYVIQAVDGAGIVSANSSTVTVTTPNATGGTTTGPQTKNCFSVPSACGYPDPTNTGVPAGTTLTASGAITASTAGQVINAKNVTGNIEIDANNVTIENTRVTLNSGSCGATTTCGNSEIRINEGVTGTIIKNVELLTAPGITCEHDIRNTSSGTVQISGSYLHGCDSNLYNVGNASVTDTYGIAKIAISSDHIENIYMSDSTLSVDHSTFLNPVGQTAVVFANVNGGSGGTCTNHVTVTNSLVAGGGYTFYPCGNGTSAGSSNTVITNNHLARCLTTPVFHSDGGNTTCQGGPDTNGYYPASGNYGISEYYFSKSTTWTGNVWDDNLQPVCIDGSSGCAGSNTGSGGGSTPDTTSPTTPTSVAATAPSSTQVNLTWNASTDSGGSGLAGYNVYRNGTKLNSSLITTANYGDSTVSADTAYTYKIEAVDGAGNKSAQTSGTAITTPASPDTTAPSTPSNLKATAANSTQVNLTWNASTDSGGSGLAGYNVYRNGTQLNTAPLTDTTYQDAKVAPSTTYQYTVQAVDKAGNTSDKTGTVSVTTPAGSSGTGTGTGTGTGSTSSDLLLGNKDIQGSPDNDVAGSPEAFRYTATASGDASTLNVYIDRNSAATTVVAGIYSDNGGKPGTLLASGSISSPTSASWNTASLNPKLNITSGTTYWIALVGVGGTVTFRDAATGDCSQSPTDDNLANLPTTWNSATTWQTCTLSAYASSASAPSTGSGGGTGSSGGSGQTGSGGTSTPTAPITITVVGHHNRPVAGATVTIGSQTVKTNSRGVATFASVPTGKQSVTIQSGSTTTTKSVTVGGTKSDSHHVTLSLTNANLNPVLLLVPVIALIAGGLVIFRPWSGKLDHATASTVSEEQIVSSSRPGADTTKPGRKLETPGAVYEPDDKDKQ